MWQRFLALFKKGKKNHPKREASSSLKSVYTPVQDLVIGMYVTELDIPWVGSPFLFQGFLIETDEELTQIKDSCLYVYIDLSKQKKRKKNSQSRFSQTENTALVFGKPPERLGTFEQEIGRAEKTYKETGVIVSGFMDKIADGGGIDAKSAKEAVQVCVDSVLHSPDAFLWLSQLKNKDEYTAQHSLNVCVLSIVLARHIGLQEEYLNNVGLCGMMHDMGKMLVPLEVLNKPGRLDDDELAIMQSHTTLGYELLKSSEGMFHGAIETALTHHEHMDGRGYPNKLNTNKLSYYSNIVAIADMYDAITSDRVYQKGRTHHEATKIMLDISGSHLDDRLVVKFIESLGVFPPGCFVELNDGSVAVVLEVSGRFKLRPKILIILDEDKNPIDEYIVDLSEMILDIAGHTLTIKTIIDPNNYKIKTEKYYQQGVIQKGFAYKK